MRKTALALLLVIAFILSACGETAGGTATSAEGSAGTSDTSPDPVPGDEDYISFADMGEMKSAEEMSGYIYEAFSQDVQERKLYSAADGVLPEKLRSYMLETPSITIEEAQERAEKLAEIALRNRWCKSWTKVEITDSAVNYYEEALEDDNAYGPTLTVRTDGTANYFWYRDELRACIYGVKLDRNGDLTEESARKLLDKVYAATGLQDFAEKYNHVDLGDVVFEHFGDTYGFYTKMSEFDLNGDGARILRCSSGALFDFSISVYGHTVYAEEITFSLPDVIRITDPQELFGAEKVWNRIAKGVTSHEIILPSGEGSGNFGFDPAGTKVLGYGLFYHSYPDERYYSPCWYYDCLDGSGTEFGVISFATDRTAPVKTISGYSADPDESSVPSYSISLSEAGKTANFAAADGVYPRGMNILNGALGVESAAFSAGNGYMFAGNPIISFRLENGKETVAYPYAHDLIEYKGKVYGIYEGTYDYWEAAVKAGTAEDYDYWWFMSFSYASFDKNGNHKDIIEDISALGYGEDKIYYVQEKYDERTETDFYELYSAKYDGSGKKRLLSVSDNNDESEEIFDALYDLTDIIEYGDDIILVSTDACVRVTPEGKANIVYSQDYNPYGNPASPSIAVYEQSLLGIRDGFAWYCASGMNHRKLILRRVKLDGTGDEELLAASIPNNSDFYQQAAFAMLEDKFFVFDKNRVYIYTGDFNSSPVVKEIPFNVDDMYMIVSQNGYLAAIEDHAYVIFDRDLNVISGKFDESGSENNTVYTLNTGKDITPVFVNQPASGEKNALLLIGGVCGGKFISTSEMGFYEDNLYPDDDWDGRVRNTLITDLVSVGDSITLYTSSGKAAAEVTETYVYFLEGEEPCFELITSAKLDENGICVASTKGDLDITVFKRDSQSEQIDLDGDGIKETVSIGVTGELLQYFEEIDDLDEEDLVYFGTFWINVKTQNGDLKYYDWIGGYHDDGGAEILCCCDLDGDGNKEIITVCEELYDWFAFWSVRNGALDYFWSESSGEGGNNTEEYSGFVYTLNRDERSYSVSWSGVCSDKELTVPSVYNGLPVTVIGDFSHCRYVHKITLPDSVLEISERAFTDCASLESIVTGNSLRSIGVNAFNGCEKLKGIELPETLEYIGYYAFADCEAFKNAVFAAKDGWTVAFPSAPSSTAVSAADLADPAKAAKLLRETHNSQIWTRTVEGSEG